MAVENCNADPEPHCLGQSLVTLVDVHCLPASYLASFQLSGKTKPKEVWLLQFPFYFKLCVCVYISMWAGACECSVHGGQMKELDPLELG